MCLQCDYHRSLYLLTFASSIPWVSSSLATYNEGSITCNSEIRVVQLQMTGHNTIQSGHYEQSTPQRQCSFEHNRQEPLSYTTGIYLVIQIHYHHSCYLFSLVKNLLIKPCYSVTVNFFLNTTFATLPHL